MCIALDKSSHFWLCYATEWRNGRDFIFPSCRQEIAIWFSTPLAGSSDWDRPRNSLSQAVAEIASHKAWGGGDWLRKEPIRPAGHLWGGKGAAGHGEATKEAGERRTSGPQTWKETGGGGCGPGSSKGKCLRVVRVGQVPVAATWLVPVLYGVTLVLLAPPATTAGGWAIRQLTSSGSAKMQMHQESLLPLLTRMQACSNGRAPGAKVDAGGAWIHSQRKPAPFWKTWDVLSVIWADL